MRAVLFIIVFEILVVFTATIVLPEAQVNDSKEYINLAKNLIADNLVFSGSLSEIIDYRLFSKRTIGYPLFLKLHWLKLPFLFVVQGLLVLLTYLLGLQLVRKIVDKKPAFLLYSIGFCSLLALFCHVGLLLSDLLLTVVICSVALVFYSEKVNDKWKPISLLWAAGLLIKPVLLPTVVLLPFIMLCQLLQKRSSVLWLSIVGFVVALTVAVNHSNTKQYEYSSISTINLAQYNAKLTISKAYGYDSAQAFSNSIFHKTPETIEEYKEYKTRANDLGKSVVFDNLKDYLYVHSVGCIKMLLDPGRFELFTLAGLETSKQSLTELIFSGDWGVIKNYLRQHSILSSLYLVFLFFRILLLLGFVVSVFTFKKHWFLWVVILYFLSITGPVGAARFFLPVSVLFLVLSTLGWVNTLAFFQKRPKG